MESAKNSSTLLQRRTKRFFRQIRPDVQRPNALENSVLARLPTELLQQIANDLPLASAVSFSLSCRHVYLLLGTQYLENLATATCDHERLVFLNLLECDLPSQIVCTPCRKLHEIKNAKKYMEGSGWRELELDCLGSDWEAMVTDYIHDNFSSTVFKMTMKHHRNFGFDARTRQLLDLLSEKTSSLPWCAGSLVREYEVRCRIKNSSLFTEKRVTFFGICRDFERHSTEFWICPHLRCESIMGTLWIETSCSDLLLQEWSVKLRCGENICWELFRCRYCLTEYQASVKHEVDCTMKLTITVWKDLGQGPDFEEWKAHLFFDWLSIPQLDAFSEEDIASVFQGGDYSAQFLGPVYAFLYDVFEQETLRIILSGRVGCGKVST
ncbi:uncharacterized protein LY89DRAFT_722097 [Mollisia scopiformis]|uniref:F-box domain-containing protein n=1 Tax=Mollisia scopiformis TaxID=149040 RepID=A0A194WXT5_MOLSC|nr:uncharacterized protein LY89DRAFT_722097 [Mollisia scopiformis]KUJ12494.1 hypothetical protein LY89DRAFT_722097 [Mollisia scopiformis]